MLRCLFVVCLIAAAFFFSAILVTSIREGLERNARHKALFLDDETALRVKMRSSKRGGKSCW